MSSSTASLVLPNELVSALHSKAWEGTECHWLIGYCLSSNKKLEVVVLSTVRCESTNEKASGIHDRYTLRSLLPQGQGLFVVGCLAVAAITTAQNDNSDIVIESDSSSLVALFQNKFPSRLQQLQQHKNNSNVSLMSLILKHAAYISQTPQKSLRYVLHTSTQMHDEMSHAHAHTNT